MASNELLTAAEELLAALVDFSPSADWHRIESEGDPGHVDPNQPTAQSLLATSQWFAEQVVDARGLVLSDNLSQSAQQFRSTLEQVRAINEFSLTVHDKAQFPNITSALRSQVFELQRQLGNWAASHAALRIDRPSGKTAENLRESERLLRDTRRNAESVKSAADEARDEAIKAGAAVFGDRFEQDAKDHIKRSKTWLVAGVFSLLLAGVATVWIMTTALTEPQAGWLWLQPLIGKIFLLSLLTYATTWCGRMSLANYHSASVNRHRANSITTVKAFRESGTADATKDAIVLEAARAVFENVQTGYLGKSAEQQPIAKTVEILRPLGD